MCGPKISTIKKKKCVQKDFFPIACCWPMGPFHGMSDRARAADALMKVNQENIRAKIQEETPQIITSLNSPALMARTSGSLTPSTASRLHRTFRRWHDNTWKQQTMGTSKHWYYCYLKNSRNEAFGNWPVCHKSNQQGTAVELTCLKNRRQKLNAS